MRLFLTFLLLTGCLGDNTTGTVDGAIESDAEATETQVTTEVTPDVTPEVIEDTVAPETVEDTTVVEDGAPDVEPETVAEIAEDIAPELPDIVPPDPCSPNPCDRSPEARCDGNDVVSYPALGACTAIDGEAACAYAATVTPCGDDFVCDLAECLPKGSPCEREFSGTISYVSELQLGNQLRDAAIDQLLDPCCVDFDGDQQVDNKLGTLIEMLSSFIDTPPNAILADEIRSGERVILLESVGLDSIADDPDFIMYGLDARDTDNSYANNAAGQGTFIVSGYTFVPGTSIPRTRMPAAITANRMTTHDATFWLERLPFIGLPINLQIERVSLTAVTSEPATGGMALDGTRVNPETQATFGAEMGGVLRIRSLYDGMNELARTCSCMTFAGDGNFIAIDDAGDALCRPPLTNTCNDGTCEGLVEYCDLILGLLSPDIDMTGDGSASSVDDGMSIGFFLKATSATVVGVDTCDN